MKVKELVAELQALDQEATVVASYKGGNGRLEVGGTEEELVYETIYMHKKILNRLPDVNEAKDKDIIKAVRLRVY